MRMLLLQSCEICPHRRWTITGPNSMFCNLVKFVYKDYEFSPGAMSVVLESHGYKVVSTDVEPRGYGRQGDFFLYTHLLAPNIVTNPPFRLAEDFIERSLAMGCHKLALLLKLSFLEGKRRTMFLKTTPLKMVYVFSTRLNMFRYGKETDNKGMIAFAWYIWEPGYSGKPMIDWI